jgi:polyphenol oxidase
VLLTDKRAEVVGAAHAGWRGLSAGVLDATLEAMQVAAGDVLAWLGPAIGPSVYEVGEEVRAAFLGAGRGPQSAFIATRPGHCLLDLYAVAHAQLARRGVREIHGGGFCTYSDAGRFFSFRRSRDKARMAAAIWLA